MKKQLLVIGGVTIDTLHFAGRTASSAGGAGLYTALTAAAAGASVTLFAQRPAPMPEMLGFVDLHLEWTGPTVPLDALPRLEIAHFGGGKAELLQAKWGAQLDLSPEDLVLPHSDYDIVHIAALGPTRKQLDFLSACRRSGLAKISAGTYGRAAYGETALVLDLVAKSDYFFMNANECGALFGQMAKIFPKPGQSIFVTNGAAGAWALVNGKTWWQPADAIEELDPTGAGDSFCGAALSALMKGADIPEALEDGVRLAGRVIQGVGPENLL